jgi:hypothetical protein
MKANNKIIGFYHEPEWEQVKEYAAWPVERKMAWLYMGLKMRKLLPEEVRKLQDQIRRGER